MSVAVLLAGVLHFVTMPAQTVDDVPASVSQRHAVTLTSNHYAIVEMTDAEIEALALAHHEAAGTCGGFTTYDTLEDAQLAASLADRDPVPTIEYSLDHPDAVRAALPQLSAERIRDTIGQLSAMKNRYYRSESGAAASAWLRDRWRSFSPRTDITLELFDQGYPQKSVIMTILGTTRADEVVVIGGHLDSIALGGLSSDAPGADDDASGIATLSEVARVLLANDYRPERTIKFIAYAAEEVGLRGSLAIVKDFKKRGVNVVGALQLDMTNYQGSDRDIWLIDDFTSKAQNAFLVRLLETYVPATWGVDRCGYACSDHAAWHNAGVPASMPFEARFKDMNNQIHSKRDTLEQSAGNANHAVRFAMLATAYAIELGKGDFGPPAAFEEPARCYPAATEHTNHREASASLRRISAIFLLLISAGLARRAAAL